MSSAYHCFCLNRIAVVDAKFRAFGADGNKGKEIKLTTMTEGQLALPDAVGNSVKIEYWDDDWQGGFIYGPIDSGDQVLIDGALSGFRVTINGKTADPIGGPTD